MPELPEVQTTVNGLLATIVGKTIKDAWSDYDSRYWKGSDIRNAKYFPVFRSHIVGKKVKTVTRRAKNILITLSDDNVILVHMKMTGHLLFGHYRHDPRAPKHKWLPVSPASLKDPFNRHIHFVLTFSKNEMLALSDSRKFAKVTFIPAEQVEKTLHLRGIGPEPLDESFTFSLFKDRLMLRPKGKIKLVLMEQKIIAGIGNIYADESLWRAGIHPLESVKHIPEKKLRDLYEAVRAVLKKGIDFGGDSMSDYRNIHGERGKFQEEHLAYRKTGTKCMKRGCRGTIERITVGARSAHFCNVHQRLTKGV